jgi:predicted permease
MGLYTCIRANFGPTASDTTNLVSWQSAFWPIIACMLAVMLQNTGRVSGSDYDHSYAPKSSIIVCLFDTLQTLIEFA